MKKVKCVVWDLDNTLWDGILLENENVIIRPDAVTLIKCFDDRGILQSIASKNNHNHAMQKLSDFGLDHFFLYPQVNWNAKSASISTIQEKLNIALDTFAFIDDSPYEIEEVKSSHPMIRCYTADQLEQLCEAPAFNPRYITQDSKNRRLIYQASIERDDLEANYVGPKDGFLASLKMTFIISEATVDDLQRAEELTERTNQLNSTGITYSYDELKQYINSDRHRLYICELSDKFGSYGKIGLALVEEHEEYDCLKLLLMSCRVISRGVGSILLSFIMQQAKSYGRTLHAMFRNTGKNDMMFITYRFANFKELEKNSRGDILFINDLMHIQPYPSHIHYIFDIKEKINAS